MLLGAAALFAFTPITQVGLIDAAFKRRNVIPARNRSAVFGLGARGRPRKRRCSFRALIHTGLADAAVVITIVVGKALHEPTQSA